VELAEEERKATYCDDFKTRIIGETRLDACILLKADQGYQGEAWTDAGICEALATTTVAVESVWRKIVE